MTRITALFSLTFFVGAAVQAQEFPGKPVRMVVPFSVGGASDIMARFAGQKLTEIWNQQAVIENRTGADGRIATEHVAKSAPDGYTLLVVEPAFVISGTLFAKLPYDTARDFTAVAMLGKAPQVFVVHPSFPARSVKEFIAIAKARPGDLNFATPSNGSAGHLAGELLKLLARVDFVNIHYRGASPALVDLLSGQASFSFVSVASALTNIKAGKLRALAVTSKNRFSAVPEIPSLDEAGVKGFDTVQWWGIVAPAGTPRTLVTRINADVAKVMSSSDVRQRVAAIGVEVSVGTQEETEAWLTSETAKWGKIVHSSGAKVQ